MINIKNLGFSYSKKRSLFEKLNLSLEAGHIYGLLGKNGTGKSTLLHLMSGLLAPQDGEIVMNGKMPCKRKVEFLSDLFLVPEEFYVPDVNADVYAKLYAPFYPNFSMEQYREYLDEFEVDRIDHKLAKMSMGQRKKTFIAFGLACNTNILLMDEPTNGLDIPSKAQFRRLMTSLSNHDRNRCIVISTHQIRDLDNLINSIVVLEKHNIIFNESIDEIGQKLAFVQYRENEMPADVLYSESDSWGGKAIVPAAEGVASAKVDMELLFNALIEKDNAILPLFKQSTKR
jgi:ABC-2 type transport system ATP-binding protein